MRRYDEAIEARDRAFALASSESRRCEALHYRWRLHYWSGNLEAALRDIDAHADCMPDSPYYGYFYPALVYAEQGDLAKAAAAARALADSEPLSARVTILASAGMRILGLADEADALLSDRLDLVDYTAVVEPPQGGEWVRTLYAFCAGLERFESLERLADVADSPRQLRGEAHFHAGVRALAQGNRQDAEEHFFNAYRSFDGAQNFTFHGKIVLEQLTSDPGWPDWLPPES
jgi:tetratricopeptide (TPR) repeat protein